MIGDRGTSCEIALMWISLDFNDEKSILVQVMPRYCQATSHYLNQCWPSSFSSYDITRIQLDESTARRQLKSPQSLSGRSMHLNLVTKWSWSWSWMTYCHLLCAMSIDPPILRYSYFKIWPWKSMVKVMWGQRSSLTFKIQRSRLWSSSNPLLTFEHVEAWSAIGMFAFRFVAIGPLLAEISEIPYLTLKIQGQGQKKKRSIKKNSIFDLENSRSRSWPRSNPMVTSEP